MRVQLSGLTKSFGAVRAVDALDLEIGSGEFVALLGPSGCGKTTTLLLVAGIYQPSGGTITFGDRRVDHLPPAERRIGMVFQSYALYPHMTVAQNIGFPLDIQRGLPRGEREQRVREAAELVRVSELLNRRPGQLSGGQQQRVAVARALAKRPDILLLDEPLSNLDARLRSEMRAEIKRLQKEIGITAIFVTHDQGEALTMADRVAVMNSGRLEAYATPLDLYQRPPNRFVAEFIGEPRMNMLPINVEARDGSIELSAREAGLRLTLSHDRASSAPLPATALLGVRAEDVTLSPADDGDARGEVYVTEPHGREQTVDVRVGSGMMRVIAPAELHAEIGQAVGLRFHPDRVHLFHPESGSRML
jgi:inositol-phosphate transport system ATP-binding protein